MIKAEFPQAPALDIDAMEAASDRWATRAKPPGSLGRLENLASHLAGVTAQCPPAIPKKPAVVVFAGDHGVVADGASAWPSEVTGAMVATICAGGAAINAFASMIGAPVTVVDVGVAAELGPIENLRAERVRPGTNSIARGAAMTTGEAVEAIGVGIMIATELIDGGADCLIAGEMGIGNTTPAAALIGAFCGQNAVRVTGGGAGIPADGIDHKRDLVERALSLAKDCREPLERFAQLGGFEIGALAGLYMTAAERRTPFIVDGVIACAALCVAEGLAPGTAAHAIAGHRSAEPAATIALDDLLLYPLLDLELRLGEGTGACLAFPLVVAAATALNDMAAIPTV